MNVLLPPLLKVGCTIFLEIRNPWGKVMEWSCIRIKKNTKKGVKPPCKKNVFFSFLYSNLGLINPYILSQSSHDLYGIGATIRIGREIVTLRAQFDIFIIFLFYFFAFFIPDAAKQSYSGVYVNIVNSIALPNISKDTKLFVILLMKFCARKKWKIIS